MGAAFSDFLCKEEENNDVSLGDDDYYNASSSPSAAKRVLTAKEKAKRERETAAAIAANEEREKKKAANDAKAKAIVSSLPWRHRYPTPKKNTQLDKEQKAVLAKRIFDAVDNDVPLLEQLCVEWAGHEVLDAYRSKVCVCVCVC